MAFKHLLLKLLACCLPALLLPMALAASSSDEAERVKRIIEKVNLHWQTNNKPEIRAYWHYAVYHTGNMEAYAVTGDERFREYSEKWAAYNGWQGTRGKDPSKWLFKGGNSENHVLFGDWQVCFQTYIDLYNYTPDEKKVRRAREVMGYQISTPRHDYWWWCDGLYMVMPVMTKMYRLTGDSRYLDKLYEYIQYTDSVMYDTTEHLYFRDARYVYPEYKSGNGKKDFWSRGDGWVLAGLAKVLKDMPANYRHRGFFEGRFRDMAKAVAALQRPEGYWTRSLLDPDFAPGPEASGTSLYAYAFYWGINNGLLDPAVYKPVADRAWQFLSKKALQKDGSVGYMQPIGEKAIASQVLTEKSTAVFGVGAFLLAASEYVRYLEAQAATADAKKPATDRAYWTSLAYRMAEPVLSRMAEGRLQKEMQVEVSPNWDGRDKRVTYMETFGRLMAGIAPWLTLPDDGTPEGARRKQLREWALKSYANAVDPQSPDYLLWRGHGQALVDAAYIAESFLRAYDALWLPLSDETKQRYIAEFTQLRRVDPPYTNWLLFSSTIESFLFKAGAAGDEYRVNSAIRKVEEWYVGDGWYADGTQFAFDYYSSYVFHPMYLETLQAMADAGRYTHLDYRQYHRRALKRAQKYSIVLERFISPEGTFPVFGRSIPYRMAAMQPLALMAWYQTLPAGLSNGQVRTGLTTVMKRMFDGRDNFNEGGFLTIGFVGRQPGAADWYTNNGSLYMTSLAFMPLGLPATHPFWTDAPQPWTSKRAWNGMAFPKDHQWKDNISTRNRF